MGEPQPAAAPSCESPSRDISSRARRGKRQRPAQRRLAVPLPRLGSRTGGRKTAAEQHAGAASAGGSNVRRNSISVPKAMTVVPHPVATVGGRVGRSRRRFRGSESARREKERERRGRSSDERVDEGALGRRVGANHGGRTGERRGEEAAERRSEWRQAESRGARRRRRCISFTAASGGGFILGAGCTTPPSLTTSLHVGPGQRSPTGQGAQQLVFLVAGASGKATIWVTGCASAPSPATHLPPWRPHSYAP